MARPSSYPRELRERAVRMVIESKGDYPSEFEAIRSVASKLGSGRRKLCANGCAGLRWTAGCGPGRPPRRSPRSRR